MEEWGLRAEVHGQLRARGHARLRVARESAICRHAQVPSTYRDSGNRSRMRFAPIEVDGPANCGIRWLVTLTDAAACREVKVGGDGRRCGV